MLPPAMHVIMSPAKNLLDTALRFRGPPARSFAGIRPQGCILSSDDRDICLRSTDNVTVVDPGLEVPLETSQTLRHLLPQVKNGLRNVHLSHVVLETIVSVMNCTPDRGLE